MLEQELRNEALSGDWEKETKAYIKRLSDYDSEVSILHKPVLVGWLRGKVIQALQSKAMVYSCT